ncbi:hypothetical protein HRG_006408 [Hirsutella rhossiliensis]|uniref:Hydrophobin n=1 Tax=Hirsutella rhossiliensis TaxID=111463 RepID=A0A9P8MXW9_9HYPO|nr:uncharacterized protein HRG_06408 [Hirsutella rhossiliensis]KAH0962306.1 hypothetical protein HRG_06408 [Hirsutella rhossiliensis]
MKYTAALSVLALAATAVATPTEGKNDYDVKDHKDYKGYGDNDYDFKGKDYKSHSDFNFKDVKVSKSHSDFDYKDVKVRKGDWDNDYYGKDYKYGHKHDGYYGKDYKYGRKDYDDYGYKGIKDYGRYDNDNDYYGNGRYHGGDFRHHGKHHHHHDRDFGNYRRGGFGHHGRDWDDDFYGRHGHHGHHRHHGHHGHHGFGGRRHHGFGGYRHGHRNEVNVCSAKGHQQVCCNGGLLGCTVQALGSHCNNNAYCCETGKSLGGLINISALNCLKLL